MFSNSRKRHSSSNSTRSSLKHTTSNDSSVTLTKDQLSTITIPIPSPTVASQSKDFSRIHQVLIVQCFVLDRIDDID